MEKIKVEITVAQITPDFIVSLKKQRYLKINGVRQNVSQPERITVIPLLWEPMDNFFKCADNEECVCEIGNDIIFSESGPCLTHPLMLMIKGLWTEEVRNKFRAAYNLGNEMHEELEKQTKNNNNPIYEQNPLPKQDEQTVQMQIEALQNELNSINAMMQSFTQNGYSEQDFIQLQQAQLDIIKQLQQLKG
ncbi:MAG: hypothetical protein FWE22_01250 [Firmicutes bacterium]|nr:hypothetical protein [Bacillota bacterium]